MKAFVVFLALGAVLTAGMAMMMNGKPWLGIVGLVVYLGLFIKYGCQTH